MNTPHKRIRLDVNDPSIPLQDESPMLEACNDVIDAIFCRLTTQKFKMHLELVCQRLKARISKRTSWNSPGDKKLRLGQDRRAKLINGTEFAHEKAPAALDRLLERIEVEEFHFFDITSECAVPVPDLIAEVFLAICGKISHHKEFINLKFVRISSLTAGVDYEPLLTSLVDCGLGNVTSLELGHKERKQYLNFFPNSIFPAISACSNLKTLILSVTAVSDMWDMFLQAFANYKCLTTINVDTVIDVDSDQAVQLAQCCSTNCPKLTSMVFVCQAIIEHFQPLAFINGLGLVNNLCSNITHFGIKLDPAAVSHRDFVATVSNWFPKLTSIDISSFQGFPSGTVLQVIGNIFENFNLPGTEIYQFKIAIDVANWGEVVYKLAQIKWHEDDEFVQISTKDGYWHCIKGNVKIKLTLNTEEYS